jgi:hypothetical protein
MEEFWGHNCSQSKHYYLFWNHRKKLKLWRVYLEGGDIRALAHTHTHTRAPQARSEKWCLCAANFEDRFAYKHNTPHLKLQQAVPSEWWLNVHEHIISHCRSNLKVKHYGDMERWGIMYLKLIYNFLNPTDTWLAVFISLLFQYKLSVKSMCGYFF